MANENGVNVQEKASDVELIELSDDDQGEDSKVSGGNDAPSSIAEENGVCDKADDTEMGSESQQVENENGQNDQEMEDSVEKHKNAEDSEMDALDQSAEPSSETEVFCTDSLNSKTETAKDLDESPNSSVVDKIAGEDNPESSQEETESSLPESKTSSNVDAKETKAGNVEMITIESEDEKSRDVQDLSTKKVEPEKKVEKVENDKEVPVEIADEITGFPSFFKGVIDVGITFAINRKNRNNLEIDDKSSVLDCPSQVVPLVLKRMNKFPKKLDKDKEEIAPSKPVSANQKNMLTIPDYYSSAAGKFLMGIGLSRVKQHYHRDIISKIKKQIRKEGEAEDLMDELKKQQEYYSLVRTANAPYHASFEKCEQCDFKTEFKSVMSYHLAFPHMTSRKEYKCNHCQFSTRDLKTILSHGQSLHQLNYTIEAPAQLYDCPICPFDTGVKTKATGHITRCLKGYIPERLLFVKDEAYPAITPKPITREDIKIYEATLQALRFSNPKMMPGGNAGGAPASSRSSLKKPVRQPQPPNPTNILNRIAPGLPQSNPLPMAAPVVPPVPNNAAAANLSNLLNSLNIKNLSPQLYQMLSSNPQFAAAAATKLFPQAPTISNPLLGGNRGTNMAQNNLLNLNLANFNNPQQTPPTVRPPNPPPSKKPKQHVQPIPQASANSHHLPEEANALPTNGGDGQLVMCEICDGYIKDVEQLRTHMHWIHKVKIHPKMLQNRPPLNCQKCHWRFFTDQGLERHLLGSHGLVTTNMQELVGQNKDGGRCSICGRVYNNKLVSHMNLYHKMNLKPAHLSYKCTVCSATFNLYRLFESHVYLIHSSGSNKRSSAACDSSTAGESKKKIARIENGN